MTTGEISIENFKNNNVEFKMKFTVTFVLLVMCFISIQATGKYDEDNYNHTIKEKKRLANAKILNGEQASRGQFPYSVAITSKNGDSWDFCGGSLINKRWVLTAAHCLSRFSEHKLKLGGLYSEEKEDDAVRMISYTAIIHEHFSTETGKNDIALIKLPKRVKFSDYLKPILLPTRRTASRDLVGMEVVTSGWGMTSDIQVLGGQIFRLSKLLMYTSLYILPKEYCNENLPDTAFCALGPENRSTCNGDSGGPVSKNVTKGDVILGLTSYGMRQTCAAPTVYTRVDHYLEWIRNHTGIPV